MLKTAAHFAGVPNVTVDAGTLVNDANLAVDLYDVDGAGNATLISRGTSLLANSGTVSFELYGNDWKLPAGHRIGALLSGSNAEWWAHVPTGQTVTVRSASLSLPFLSCARTKTIQGAPSIKLEDYKAGAPFAVDAQTIGRARRTRSRSPPRLPTAADRRRKAREARRPGRSSQRPMVELLAAAGDARSGAAHADPARAADLRASVDRVDSVLRGAVPRAWPVEVVGGAQGQDHGGGGSQAFDRSARRGCLGRRWQ